jgi:opacity protein-like surface antigen
MRVVLAMLIFSLMPAWADAQTSLPANDIQGAIGWSGADHEHVESRQWYGSALAGLSAGHYWTDHAKTEVEAAWNSPGSRELFENIEREGYATYAISTYKAGDVRIGVAQLYQFGRNQWAHPYVGAGVDLVRRHVSLERPAQTRTVFLRNGNIPVQVPALSMQKTTFFAHAVLKTGLKMYVSEKTFFVTELKFGIRRDVDHAVWKIGMGRDF